MTKLDSKIPEGPIAEKWTNYKSTQALVNPANKRKLDVIVVGTGLAGDAAVVLLDHVGIPAVRAEGPHLVGEIEFRVIVITDDGIMFQSRLNPDTYIDDIVDVGDF